MRDSQRVGIVGGGLSTLMLLHFLGKKQTQNIQYTIFEPEAELGKGRPYGSLSDPSFLLNSPIVRTNFTIEEQNLEQWVHKQLENPDAPALLLEPPLAEQSTLPIEKRYLSRQNFGRYITETFNVSRDLDVTHKRKRVETITRKDKKLCVVSGDESFLCDKVIIATGNPPPQSFHTLKKTAHYFADPYTRLAELKKQLETLNRKKGKLIILGTSSAFLDMIRIFQSYSELLPHKIKAISTSGTLPFKGTLSKDIPYQLQYLVRTVPVNQLTECLKRERTTAFTQGYSVLELRKVVSAFTKEYLARCTREQQQEFVSTQSRKFESLMKRGCPEVIYFAEQLCKRHILDIASARIEQIASSSEGELKVTTVDQAGRRHTDSAQVIINCMGPGQISRENPLFASLLECGAQLSPCKSGFWADDNFRLAADIYGIGPIINGSINSSGTFYNLENAGRIYALAKLVSKMISEHLHANTNSPSLAV